MRQSLLIWVVVLVLCLAACSQEAEQQEMLTNSSQHAKEEPVIPEVKLPDKSQTVYEVSYCPHSYILSCNTVRITASGVFVQFQNILERPLEDISLQVQGDCAGNAYLGSLQAKEKRVIQICNLTEQKEDFSATLRFKYQESKLPKSLSVRLYGDYPR